MKFKKQNPELDLDIEYVLHTSMIQKLKNGEVELVITNHPEITENLRFYQILEEHSVMVTRSSHRGWEKLVSHPKDLIDQKFVGYTPVDRLLNDFLKNHLKPLDISKLKRLSSVNSHQSIIDHLLLEDSFAVLPRFSVDHLLKSGKLKLCLEKENIHPLYLVELNKSKSPLKERVFKKFILELGKSNSVSGV